MSNTKFLFFILNEENYCAYNHNQISCHTYQIQNHCIENCKEHGAYHKRDFKCFFVVFESENSYGVFQISNNGKQSKKTTVVEPESKHNTKADKHPLYRLVVSSLYGENIPEYAHTVLNCRTVSFQSNRPGTIYSLAYALDKKHAFCSFSGGAYRVSHHCQNTA